jgi:hypothetical protein
MFRTDTKKLQDETIPVIAVTDVFFFFHTTGGFLTENWGKFKRLLNRRCKTCSGNVCDLFAFQGAKLGLLDLFARGGVDV